MHIVIIGNGIAGNAVASSIRKHDRLCKVTIISEETCQSYDPGSLPYYVSNDVPRQAVFLRDGEDYAANNINLLLGHKVANIDTGNKKLSLENHDEIDYDKLVIATGGKLFIPRIEGIDKVGVLGCKTLPEADQLASHNGKNAVVIGSGLIGIEASEALSKKGYEVYLVELLAWIMPKVFDEKPARLMAEGLIAKGIHVLTNEKVLSIIGDTHVRGVITDQRELVCDTVVLATGVLPANELAVRAGITIGMTRGIKVNDHMMTTVPDVYACGDCVESKDAFSGESTLSLLRHNAIEQASVIAQSCMGIQRNYRGSWNFTRAHYFNTHGISIGKTLSTFHDPENAEVIEGFYGPDYYRLIMYQGKLVGAQLIGDRLTKQAGLLLGALWRQDDLGDLRANWKTIHEFNSPYPWQYRILGRYMNLGEEVSLIWIISIRLLALDQQV